jgi:anti-sigma-K factor RskA
VAMHHEELRELTGAYALDAVSERERREFETHLDVCPICTEEVRSLRAAAAELAAAVPYRRPPAELRSRVLASIEKSASATTTSGLTTSVQSRAAWWLAAAASLTAVAIGVYALTLRSQVNLLESELRIARVQAATAQQQLAQAQNDIRLVNASMEILVSPDVVRFDLKGRGRAPNATARAFWSRSRGVLFAAAALPALPSTEVYQLRLIAAGGPVSAGLLAPNAAGSTMMLGETKADVAKAFAVTIERAGGVEKPTLDAMVLMGAAP